MAAIQLLLKTAMQTFLRLKDNFVFSPLPIVSEKCHKMKNPIINNPILYDAFLRTFTLRNFRLIG